MRFFLMMILLSSLFACNPQNQQTSDDGSGSGDKPGSGSGIVIIGDPDAEPTCGDCKTKYSCDPQCIQDHCGGRPPAGCEGDTDTGTGSGGGPLSVKDPSSI